MTSFHSWFSSWCFRPEDPLKNIRSSEFSWQRKMNKNVFVLTAVAFSFVSFLWFRNSQDAVDGIGRACPVPVCSENGGWRSRLRQARQNIVIWFLVTQFVSNDSVKTLNVISNFKAKFNTRHHSCIWANTGISARVSLVPVVVACATSQCRGRAV